MNNVDCFMNDTLDNFNFPQGLSQQDFQINNNSQKKKSEDTQVSFDDSAFFNDLTFELDTLDSSQNNQGNCIARRKLQDSVSVQISKAKEKPSNDFQNKPKTKPETISKQSPNVKNMAKSDPKLSPKSRILFPKISNENNTSKPRPKCDEQPKKSLQMTPKVKLKHLFVNNTTKENENLLEDKIINVENRENYIEKQLHLNCDLTNKPLNSGCPKFIKKNDELGKKTNMVPQEQSNNLENAKQSLVNTKMSKLSSWGLPSTVLEKYETRKITSMFPWQVECLTNPKVLHGMSNLIYSAPTSAGKTLVSEILAMKTIFERKKKVIFILPFVSIVREKMYYFQDILGTSGIRVEGFMGSYNPPGGFNSIQFAICTIEKANSLINRLLEEGKLSEIGAVLVDEMHLLGDPHRGYLLELLLTKLCYISIKDKNVKIQIIGMSATLPNLDQLAEWLGAELYSTCFRPIPLHEQVIVKGEIYDKDMKVVRKVVTPPDIETDTDNVFQLCLETIEENCSVLIFCPTKQWCENLAQQIAKAFYKIGRSDSDRGARLRSQIKGEKVMEVLEQLKFCPIGLDDILKLTVTFGVAYHHAGLTMDERDIIEGAFRSGAVRVLIATSTLSSGVNLPARRVLIRTPNFHGKTLDFLTYKQMIGRAGRLGKDTLGESFLICPPNEFQKAKELLSGKLPPVESCLEGDGKLKRAILEVVASGVASSPADVKLFTQCTLLASMREFKKNRNMDSEDTRSDDSLDEVDNIANPIEQAVNFLITHEFIRLQKTPSGEQKYVATNLGKACLSSSIAPDEGLTLFTELERARQNFVLDGELHLIYLVTPYSACYSWGNIDWIFYLELFEKLPRNMKKVADLVGVRERWLVTATRNKIDMNNKDNYRNVMIHKRYFVALALQDLVNEKPLGEVCGKFNCNRGMLQSLQQSASTFAGMVTSFSRQLGWSSVEILLSQFQDRMQFGVSRDLLDLMRLPSLNGKLARTLYNAGIETTVQLANSDIDTIEGILYKATPFESAKQKEGESKQENKERNKLRTVFVTGKDGLTEREAADLLINEARKYLQIEMGLQEAKWTNQNLNESSDDDMDTSERLHDHSEPEVVDKQSKNSKNENNISKVSNPNSEAVEATDLNTRNVVGVSQSIHKKTEDNQSDFQVVKRQSKNSTNKNILYKTLDKESQSPDPTDLSTLNVTDKNLSMHKKTENPNDLKIIEKPSKNTDSAEAVDSNKATKEETVQISQEFVETPEQQMLNVSAESTKIDDFSNSSLSSLDLNISTNSSLQCDKNDLVLNVSSQSDQLLLNLNKGSDNGLSKKSNTNNIKIDLKNYETPNKNEEINMSDSSLFEEINFTKIEEMIEHPKFKNVSDKVCIKERKTELIISESSTSNNSIENQKSDSSFLEASFSLQLSDNPSGKSTASQEDAVLEKLLTAENTTARKENNLQNTPKRKREKEDSESDDSFLEATPTKKKKEISTPKPGSSVVRNLSQLSLKETEYMNFNVIDVTRNEEVFKIFEKEILEQKIISFTIACNKLEESKPTIGGNILSSSSFLRKDSKNVFKHEERKIEGFAISCGDNKSFYLSLEKPNVATNCINLLQKLFQKPNLLVRIFDAKEQIKLLKHGCGVHFSSKLEDPKIQCWLLDPEDREQNIRTMALEDGPQLVHNIADMAKSCKTLGSIGLYVKHCCPIDARQRSSVETILTWHLVDSLKGKLNCQMPKCHMTSDAKFLNTYELEMKTLLYISKMELNGMSVNKKVLQNMADLLQNQQNSIERKAYSYAGRRFNFSSTTEVAKVTGMFKGKKVSTKKQVLEKNEHPISELVLLWRKINFTLTKMVHPLIQAVENDRIKGCYVTHTASGRISMHEPNLQMVTKDFTYTDPQKKTDIIISLRGAFQTPEGHTLISADFCQLELRILTYLSKDRTLERIIKKDGDVFRMIAAKWNNLSEDKVDDQMRQNAKQLCYGIFYGMGNKTLAEQLQITEEEAAEFVESFKNTYPGIKEYIRKTIVECRKNGYVETINGRRRYLPNINDGDISKKGQAERQAINTTIQGSAADLAKNAMLCVEDKMADIFKRSSKKPILVLHLHDELIYEACDKYVEKVAKIMKKFMEKSAEGLGNFPVKVKTGKSWGELQEYHF